jgi:CheY-like chemotaxis protein/GAF domain-containing protein
MGKSKPKVVVLGGADSPAAALAESLRHLYDITLVDDPDLKAALKKAKGSIVVSSSDRIVPPMAGMQQSATLLEAIGEGVSLTRPDGEVIWANRRFARLNEEAREHIARFCRQAFAWFDQRDADDTTPKECRFDVDETETSRSYEIWISPAPKGPSLDTGKPEARLAVVVRDVTESRRIQHKIEAISRAGHDLASLEAESVAKMDVIERLELLRKKVVRYCHDLLAFDHFAIRLVDFQSGKLELLMSSGLPQEAIELDLVPALEGQGICGYVAASGQSYVCADIRQDRLFLPGLVDARSSLTIPLRLHDKVIGVMDIESEKVAAFGEEDRRFAEIFARYIALAIHMLDLLVVERQTTNRNVSGRFEGELSEPLEDIVHEADWFNRLAEQDPEAARHLARIRSDVDIIRRRVRGVASGPQTLLGVDQALNVRRKDPILNEKRILIADDEPNIRRVIRDVLHNRGAEVVTCSDGKEAVEAIRKAAEGDGLDLVVSDIKMPDRNGYEVFAAVRKTMSHVPVILMTGFGYDPSHSIVRASQEGLQSVLFKPFQVERLLDEVKRALVESGAKADAKKV